MHGGGPAFVAGTAFDPATSGKPILWAGGTVNYYTDQGDLSALLPQTSANSFVADAFSRWTSVISAALSATRAGALSEDVNGSNVVATANGISLPADIQPIATKPFAIVYDFDGHVTDTLLGTGASDPTLCATNSVIGGADRFSSDAHIAHALIILNGRCAQANADLLPLKYHLIRAIGRALGMGWSQANDNVITGTPVPHSSDFAGFPLMHPQEPFCVGVITSCLPNADQLRMDDRATVSRLYPVTAQNAASFPGKQIFKVTTVSIHGSVYFPDVRGAAGQPMQGVNIVARLIDPISGLPSHTAVASSVSGAMFRGNAGNPVSGYGTTQRFDSFGGADPSFEGQFDLSGLEIPAGQTSASFQLTMEAVNPLYRDDATVGPYSAGMVTPSGRQQTITLINLAAGADVTQNIVMTGAPVTASDNQLRTIQHPLPANGDWWGTIAGYGRAEFYRVNAQANRTIGLQVTSMNESLAPSSNKLRPELGLWIGTDPLTAAPNALGGSFNGGSTGVTVLNAPVASPGIMQLGIVDYRGDGRPDFIYHAHALYADSVSPSRLPQSGGRLVIKGLGFTPGIAVTVGANAATILAIDANSIVAQSPALSAGPQTVRVQDSSRGLSTTMTNVLSVGVLNGDQIIGLSAPSPSVSVGLTTPDQVRFRVVGADGLTPAPSVPVTLNVSPNTSRINACGASSCMLTTDAQGDIASFVGVNFAGDNIITASLSNGQQLQRTIVGTSSLALSAVPPQFRLPAGSSMTVPLAVKLLTSGAGVSGRQITYSITSGSGSLSSGTAVTDATGSAAVNVTVTNLTSSISINACATGIPCAQFTIFSVDASAIALQKVSGDGQMLAVGETFQPVTLRVVDSASPPNAVANVPVSITGAVFSTMQPDCAPDTGICRPAMPHALANLSTTLMSDANGIVTYTPSIQSAWGAVQVGIMATAGTGAQQSFNLQVFVPAQ